MSSLKGNAKTTNETMVLRLEENKLGEINLHHPRTERIIGNNESVIFRIFNDGCQPACYAVTIDDGGSNRTDSGGNNSDEVTVGYVKLVDAGNAPRAFEGMQFELGKIDVPAGTPIIVRIDPHMCCVIVTRYTWAGGSTDPRLVLAAPAAGGTIDANITHPVFDSPAITRPGWAPRP